MDNFMLYIWIAATVFFIIIEAATTTLVSIWFVAGTIAAAVSGIFTDSIPVQILVFLVVTSIALVATRPLVKKSRNHKKVNTNSDRFIGKTGLVTEEINNIQGKGQVVIMGKVWTARSKDDTIIAENQDVKVVCIEGVKLIVTPVQK